MALRMRVSISAIGSVIAIGNRYPPFKKLPTGFGDAGDVAGVRVVTETDAAHLEFAEIAVRSAADFAAVVLAGGEFGFLRPFFD